MSKFFTLLRLNLVDFKKKRAKESLKAKEKYYEDYAWKDLCEDLIKLKKLRVPELNQYLEHHRLDKHVKSTTNDKVKVITRHWLLQMNPEGTDLLQTRLREADEAENEPLRDSDNDDSNEDDTGESESSSDEENENDRQAKKMITLTLVKETNRVMSLIISFIDA